MAICYNVWPFCVVCGPLVYFFRFGILGPSKIWQPCLTHEEQLRVVGAWLVVGRVGQLDLRQVDAVVVRTQNVLELKQGGGTLVR
jgi:hypothetical protein